jgi:hypothetical protein
VVVLAEEKIQLSHQQQEGLVVVVDPLHQQQEQQELPVKGLQEPMEMHHHRIRVEVEVEPARLEIPTALATAATE